MTSGLLSTSSGSPAAPIKPHLHQLVVDEVTEEVAAVLRALRALRGRAHRAAHRARCVHGSRLGGRRRRRRGLVLAFKRPVQATVVAKASEQPVAAIVPGQAVVAKAEALLLEAVIVETLAEAGVTEATLAEPQAGVLAVVQAAVPADLHLEDEAG